MNLIATAIIVVGGPNLVAYQVGSSFAKAGLKSDETEETWNKFKGDVQNFLLTQVGMGKRDEGLADTIPKDK